MSSTLLFDFMNSDDFELGHDLFVRDVKTLSSLSKQNYPPGPPSDCDSEGNFAVSAQTLTEARKKKRKRGRRPFRAGQLYDAHPNSPRENSKKRQEYALQEPTEPKDIRVGDDYQVDESCIPEYTEYSWEHGDSILESPQENPAAKNDLTNFLNWAKKQFLQPGMVTMAYLPSARVTLASTPPSQDSADSKKWEPVLHYAQRYCVIVSYKESSGGSSDMVTVYDGESHHLVSTNLCSILIPPLTASNVTAEQTNDSAADFSPSDGMRSVSLTDIWNTCISPEQYISDICSVR